MHLWMDVMRDLEHLLNDYERLFDAWEAGGVSGLVIGSMNFNAPKLVPGQRTVAGITDRTPIPTFDPNPYVYHRLGVEVPPSPQERLIEKRPQVDDMLTAAKDRGWSVWIFRPYSGEGKGGNGHQITDEASRVARCARMIDTLEHYPMVDGGIMDGPEWGYEIAQHHLDRRSYIFDDLPESVAEKCTRTWFRLPCTRLREESALPVPSFADSVPIGVTRFGGIARSLSTAWWRSGSFGVV